jgi:predicted  nucleic acid-binding Zn-ribbon protein
VNRINARKREHEELLKRVKESDEFDALKYQMLSSESGTHSLSYNVALNGKESVCTETYVDGVRTRLVYDFNRPQLTKEELEKEFRGLVEFV